MISKHKSHWFLDSLLRFLMVLALTSTIITLLVLAEANAFWVAGPFYGGSLRYGKNSGISRPITICSSSGDLNFEIFKRLQV